MAEPLALRAAAEAGSAPLEGRRILVTGGASGIGRATACTLLARGADVTVLDRDEDALAQVADGLSCHGVLADVTDDAALGRAVEHAARQMHGLDGVVNAAGIHLRGRVEDIDPQAFRHLLDVNLVGPYAVVRHCLSWLRRRPGATVVNVASAMGLLTNAAGRSAYATSKGGLVTLTRALAAELAPHIRVNSVCPGLVATPMAAGVTDQVVNYALGRLAEPGEIAGAIAFLTGPESSFVTGAALAADGGRSFH